MANEIYCKSWWGDESNKFSVPNFPDCGDVPIGDFIISENGEFLLAENNDNLIIE
jgi:hypothetical protein